MLSALIAMTTLSATAAQTPVNYELTIDVAETGKIVTKTTKVELAFTLDDGETVTVGGETADGAIIENSATISHNGDSMDAAFRLCRPEVTPCEVVAEPTIQLEIGERATLSAGPKEETGIRYSIELTPRAD